MLADEGGTVLRVAATRGFKVSPDEVDEIPIGEGVAGMALRPARRHGRRVTPALS